MIVYGYRDASAGVVPLTNFECPVCRKADTFQFVYLSRHFHIFWIPLFPFKRSFKAACPGCGFVVEMAHMPPEIKERFNREKGMYSLRPPVWQFAGIAIIAVLIGVGVYNSEQNSKENKAFLANPAIGDIYHIKLENGNFSTFKILGVKSDSIDIAFNKYEVNKSTGLDDIDVSDNYEEQYRVDKAFFTGLESEDQIIDIIRD